MTPCILAVSFTHRSLPVKDLAEGFDKNRKIALYIYKSSDI